MSLPASAARALALAALVPLLSGCLGSGPAPAPEPLAQRGPDALALTDCVVLSAAADHPGATASGTRPEGWGPSRGLLEQVGVRAMRCGRVSLGPFERGPLHLAFDWHSNAEAPPSCAADGATRVLGTLWTEDAELAAHLRGRYGLPAFQSPVSEASAELAGGSRHEWSWGPAAQESRLTLVVGGQPIQRSGAFDAFWPAGAGVGRLAFDWSATQPSLGVAQASMRPPMMGGEFTGRGTWQEGFEASGSLARFVDAACGEEVAP